MEPIQKYNSFKQEMNGATKRISYTEFTKLSLQDRLLQSQHLRKLKPQMIPVILSAYQKQIPPLPNCKFLIEKNSLLHIEFCKIREYINKNKGVSPNETLYFCHRRKVLNGSRKVVDFVEEVGGKGGYGPEGKEGGAREDDGWLYLEYAIQDWSG